MLVTKNYFKKFQYVVVGLCIFAAVFVGSLQSAIIIFSVKKGKN